MMTVTLKKAIRLNFIFIFLFILGVIIGINHGWINRTSSNISSTDTDKVCASIKNNTNFIPVKECVISNDHRIDITINASRSEARKICTDVITQTQIFYKEPKWELQIFSPYSGGKIIAACKIQSIQEKASDLVRNVVMYVYFNNT